MKKAMLLFFLITCTIPFSFVVGQNLKLPCWINGSWKNSLVSDTRKFVSWTFDHDSIFIVNGLKLNKRENLIHDYAGYKITEISDSSLYRVTFSKDNETVVYEFKLIKDDNISKPVFTYSLTINGINKVEHSTSAYLRFLKK